MIYKHSDLIGSITGIVVPDGISEIEDETFAGCTLWGSVNFSGDIKSVGNASFNFCFKEEYKLKITSDFLRCIEHYHLLKDKAEYDYHLNDPNGGNSNALPGNILRMLNVAVSGVPSSAHGFNHKMATKFFE